MKRGLRLPDWMDELPGQPGSGDTVAKINARPERVRSFVKAQRLADAVLTRAQAQSPEVSDEEIARAFLALVAEGLALKGAAASLRDQAIARRDTPGGRASARLLSQIRADGDWHPRRWRDEAVAALLTWLLLPREQGRGLSPERASALLQPLLPDLGLVGELKTTFAAENIRAWAQRWL